MFKKFFAVFFLAAALVVVGQVSKVEAAEVYVGTYSDGDDVYLLTETIQLFGAPFDCSCTVRAGNAYIDYLFGWDDEGVLSYKNSEGYQGLVYDGSSPVARAIYRYIRGR